MKLRMSPYSAKTILELRDNCTQPTTEAHCADHLSAIVRIFGSMGMSIDLAVMTDEQWRSGTDKDRLKWSPMLQLRCAIFWTLAGYAVEVSNSPEDLNRWSAYADAVLGKDFRFDDPGIPGAGGEWEGDFEDAMRDCVRDPYNSSLVEVRERMVQLGLWTDSDQAEYLEELMNT